jgi:hypothetical protein
MRNHRTLRIIFFILGALLGAWLLIRFGLDLGSKTAK